jgi:hypothetical protein
MFAGNTVAAMITSEKRAVIILVFDIIYPNYTISKHIL